MRQNLRGFVTVLTILATQSVVSLAEGQTLLTGGGTLTLGGSGGYTGGTVVSAGTLVVTSSDALGTSSVEVCPGALLVLDTTVGPIADTATLQLDSDNAGNYGRVDFDGNTFNDIVGSLILGGSTMPAGIYGSSSSSAQFQYDTYFSGPGTFSVVPEPSTFVLLGVGGISLAAYAWRRKRQPA
jgi:autotransporter-associated beta strand protein